MKHTLADLRKGRLGKPKPNRRKGKKSKPKTPRQLLEIKLDRLCKEVVLERDGFCVTPPPKKGHSDVRQPGHLITRGKESVRWDLYNINEQCSSCNMRHENFWSYYDDWFIVKFGQEQRLRLGKDSETVVKMSMDDLKRLYGELEGIRKWQIAEDMLGNRWKPYFAQKEIFDGSWRKK